jgi:hypothetical protein
MNNLKKRYVIAKLQFLVDKSLDEHFVISNLLKEECYIGSKKDPENILQECKKNIEIELRQLHFRIEQVQTF